MLFVAFYAAQGDSLEMLTNTQGGAQDSIVIGGTQQLSLKLAEKLGPIVRLNQEVTHIAQDAQGVHITTAAGSVIRAAHAVMAMPPVAAGRLTFDPPLSPSRHELQQRMPMGRYDKVIVTYDKAFWRDAGYTGEVASVRGPITASYDDDPGDGSAALLNFIGGDHALHWQALPPDQQKQAVLDCLARWFGDAARHPTAYGYNPWAEQPHTGGAPVAIMAPGRAQPVGSGAPRTMWADLLGGDGSGGQMDRLYGWGHSRRRGRGGGDYGRVDIAGDAPSPVVPSTLSRDERSSSSNTRPHNPGGAALTLAWITAAIGAYVALHTLWMVIICWSPLPFGDQWSEIVTGRPLTLSWLVSQHLEHRILVPRLVFLADRWLAGETNRINYAVNFAMQCGLAVLIYVISRGAGVRGAAARIWAAGFCSALLLWAGQYQNFVWGFQVQFFGVVLAASGVFAVLALRPATLSTLALVTLLEAIAAYTLASGVLAGFLAVGLALALGRPWRFTCALAGASLLILASYLVHYHTPPESSDPFAAWHHAGGIAVYLLAALGAPVANLVLLHAPLGVDSWFASAPGCWGAMSSRASSGACGARALR